MTDSPDIMNPSTTAESGGPSTLTGGADLLLVALAREHGEPRTDTAVQWLTAVDAVRCRNQLYR